jgi:hypothetical protein
MSAPGPGPDVVREDDGSIMFTFGGGTPADSLVAAFASLPADAWAADILMIWYSDQESWRGQDLTT